MIPAWWLPLHRPVPHVTAIGALIRQTFLRRGQEMAQSKKDVLATLQAELAFVERGGYRTPEKAAWRPQFIFEDSPTCLNFRNFGQRHPCSQCALIDFVPNGIKQERFPCRYIALDESGHTLDSLYRTATEEEAHAIAAG